jgi:hypothetical protein
MAAGINVLTLSDPVDPSTFASAEADHVPKMCSVDGFEGLHIVHTGEREVTLVILGRDEAVLDRLATEVGSPWTVANIVPLLAGPPDRRIGPSLVSAGA